MKNIIKKTSFGFQIGSWRTPVSICWRKEQIFRWYGIRFFEKYNELCFGRLEIRIWKLKFLRCGSGIFIFREMPYDKSKSWINE